MKEWIRERDQLLELLSKESALPPHELIRRRVELDIANELIALVTYSHQARTTDLSSQSGDSI